MSIWVNAIERQEGAKCSPEEWLAFVKIGQIREVLSPRFVQLINLARAEGLLEGLLEGDSEMVQRRGSELLSCLAARINTDYSITQKSTPTLDWTGQ